LNLYEILKSKSAGCRGCHPSRRHTLRRRHRFHGRRPYGGRNSHITFRSLPSHHPHAPRLRRTSLRHIEYAKARRSPSTRALSRLRAGVEFLLHLPQLLRSVLTSQTNTQQTWHSDCLGLVRRQMETSNPLWHAVWPGRLRELARIVPEVSKDADQRHAPIGS
jgi:hypothetical protein